jgi:hypothetical protein
MNRPKFYIEFTLRYPDGDAHDGGSIAVPVLYAWQAAPYDFHVQLDTPEGADHLNVFPEFPTRRGNYLLPFDPCLGDRKDFKVVPRYKWRLRQNQTVIHPAVVCYEMHFRGTPSDERIVASSEYLQLLQNLWESPNR